ncbi:MAG: hypothetical protein Q4F21_12015, partial [Lachnospiraceae bacterium]|nr:hypothetical protein [Lachnospiraceae bacterium]
MVKRKIVKKLLTCIITSLVISNVFLMIGSANTSNYQNFDFDEVIYDWSYNNRIGYVWKKNTSSGVVNTLKSAGGG